MSAQPRRAQLLIDFLNTVDVESHTDALDSAKGFVSWAQSHGHNPGDRARARALRDAIRDGLTGQRTALPDVAIRVGLDSAGMPQLTPADVAQAVICDAIDLAASGDWNRVKLCPADDCREAFYDISRNRSRIWCDMADCGNRAKVRTFRNRAADESHRTP